MTESGKQRRVLLTVLVVNIFVFIAGVGLLITGIVATVIAFVVLGILIAASGATVVVTVGMRLGKGSS